MKHRRIASFETIEMIKYRWSRLLPYNQKKRERRNKEKSKFIDFHKPPEMQTLLFASHHLHSIPLYLNNNNVSHCIDTGAVSNVYFFFPFFCFLSQFLFFGVFGFSSEKFSLIQFEFKTR